MKLSQLRASKREWLGQFGFKLFWQWYDGLSEDERNELDHFLEQPDAELQVGRMPVSERKTMFLSALRLTQHSRAGV